MVSASLQQSLLVSANVIRSLLVSANLQRSLLVSSSLYRSLLVSHMSKFAIKILCPHRTVHLVHRTTMDIQYLSLQSYVCYMCSLETWTSYIPSVHLGYIGLSNGIPPLPKCNPNSTVCPIPLYQVG